MVFFDNYNTLERRWSEVQEKLVFSPNDCVLDIGCAEGLITYEIAKLYPTIFVCGIDNDKSKLDNRPTEGISSGGTIVFLNKDILNTHPIDLLPSQCKFWDKILCLGVLHKLPVRFIPEILLRIFESTHEVVFRISEESTKEILELILEIGTEQKFASRYYKSRFHHQGPIILMNKVVALTSAI